jgi:GxxExxY protein
LDIVVEGVLVIELKAVQSLGAIQDAQLITYLRLSGCLVGLILNFNVPVLKNGIRRLVNNLAEPERSSD